MAANYSSSRVYQIPLQCFVDELRAPQFYSMLGFSPGRETPTPSGPVFYFARGMSMLSWGDSLTVSIYPIAPGSVQVTVSSECAMPTQVIDWGQNKKNVEKIFAHLETYVPRRAAIGCPGCGCARTEGAFCTQCGTKY